MKNPFLGFSIRVFAAARANKRKNYCFFNHIAPKLDFFIFVWYNVLRILKKRRIIMSNINIVLVEPEIPQNTGNIARTCSVTGAALHLVKPLGFEIDDKKMKRAGLDYWHELEIYYYENLAEFLEKNKDENLYFFSKKASHIYSEIEYPERVFLVFGKETKGLPEALLEERFESSLRMPMRAGSRSLNLSNTVAIAVYEVLRTRDFEDLKCDGDIIREKML